MSRIIGDALSGRTIRASGMLNFQVSASEAGNVTLILAQIKESEWLWAEFRGEGNIQLHTKDYKLLCKKYDSPAHGNAAFRVNGVKKRNAADRTRMVRYGLRLILLEQPFVFSGENFNMQKNRNAAYVFADLYKLSLKLGQLQQESREDSFEQRRRKQAEQEWASQLIQMINKQEDTDFAETKKKYFYYDRFTEAVSSQVKGVSYSFKVVIDEKYAYNDLAISADPFPLTYEGLIAGKVTRSDEHETILSFAHSVDYGKIPKQGYLLVVPNNTTYRVQKRTVQELIDGQSVNEKLLNYLVHKEFESYDATGSEHPKGGSLLPKQEEAVEKAVATNDFLLVQGPPGTGKTTIIVEMVRRLIGKGERVLISSKNNLAVDNVLEQLIDDGIDCVRIGREEKVKVAKVKDVLLDRVAVKLQENMISRCSEDQKLLQSERARAEEFTRLLGEVSEDVGRFQAIHRHAAGFRQNLWKLEKKAKWKLFHFFAPLALLRKTTKLLPFLKITTEGFELKAQTKLKTALTENNGYQELLIRLEAEEGQENTHLLMLSAKLDGFLEPEKVAGLAEEENWHRLQQKAANTLASFQKQTSISADWIDELQERQQSLYPLLLRTVPVLGATCIGIDTSPEFRDTEFDTVIIDESGQITIFDVLVPMARAKKVILIGDHMQLPPVSDSNLAKEFKEMELPSEWIEKSLFEELYYKAPDSHKVMLDTQFRMHPLVASFISSEFYGGEYISGVSPEQRTIGWDLYESPLVFIDTTRCDERFQQCIPDEDHLVYFNQLEAYLAAQELIKILKFGRKPEEIGIVAPYKKQKMIIEGHLPSMLKEAGFSPEETRRIVSGVEIDTVDSFQGRGKEIILFSFTRSSPDFEIGFLRELRRLNVTMTRCKSLLVLIGDMETLANAKDKRSAVLFRNLRNYISRHGQYVDAKLLLKEGEAPWRQLV
ncbi:AAA domain-containing protein [Bacillus sp. FJAT-27245]|uniref:AAA domain-containing protein n=1 Tax=Bacillus sp. FJAT-27245 TaxID=1684144 RepID=UPI0006A7BA40|nr:AAA domain-containing protein [Bacillus sp. FJAT-27245]